MFNILISAVAIVFILLGLVAMVTPIPVGVVFITFGLSTLICVNVRARIIVSNIRKKNRFLNRRFTSMENSLKGGRFHFLHQAFIETRPANSPITDEPRAKN